MDIAGNIGAAWVCLVSGVCVAIVGGRMNYTGTMKGKTVKAVIGWLMITGGGFVCLVGAMPLVYSATCHVWGCE